MKIICLLLFSISVLGQNPELHYSQIQFDSPDCCWRKLTKAGKNAEAADLIVAYLQNGKPENKHSLHWHAGQLFADAGNNKMAIRYFQKTRNIFYRWFGGEEGRAWYFYANGEIAFLKRDQKKLQKIISIWNKKLPKDLNYRQLILLSENWDKTYTEALRE